MKSIIKRKEGEEQPFVKAGMFKIRVPFVHTGWEMPEAIQGFLMVATPLSGSALVMQLTGLPFELAVLFVFVNNCLYLLNPVLGDPTFPGWITPAVPLTMSYVLQYAEGPDRIKALVGLQFMLALFYLVFGLTGLSNKIINIVPASMRGGILLGAGISCMIDCLTKKMAGGPLSLTISMLISITLLYSVHVADKRGRNKLLNVLSKYALSVGMIGGLVLSVIFKEVEMPKNIFADGIFLSFRDYGTVLKTSTIFGVGFPSGKFFIAAIPMTITLYILSFGDFVYADSFIKSAAAVRTEAPIDYNSNRSNVVCALRNIIMGTFFPFPGMCGPLWGAGTTSVVERYKVTPTMGSIFDGSIPFIVTMSIGLFLRPVVNVFQPILFLGLGLSFVVQGFASIYIAMDSLNTPEERGCGGLMGIVLAVLGATWGLAAGILLHLLVGVRKKSVENSKEGAAENV